MYEKPTIDMHCHILPGVDDGATDLHQAMEMLRQAYADGTRAMILTPHGHNCGPKWQETFVLLQSTIRDSFPDLRLYLGSEILYDLETVDRLDSADARCLNGSHYCLLEFHTTAWRSQIVRAVSDVLYGGYIPIIAHAERYKIIRSDAELLDELLDMGALIQLNADSIMGEQGFLVKRFCRKLLKEKKVHFIASDAHDTANRPPLLDACRKLVNRKYGSAYADALFYDHALAVIEDRVI